MRQWVSVPFEEPKAEPVAQAPPPPTTTRPTVFVAVPTYDGWLKAHAFKGLAMASETAGIQIEFGFGSLLGRVFNELWTRALNSRKLVPWDFWAMMHADIQAPEGWLDVLMEEQRRTGADVLSVAVPIKDDRKLSSTGVVQTDGTIRRLTLKEIHRLPETFSAADLPSIGISAPLVVNTGLWVADFRKPWVEEVVFNIGDHIRKEPDGTFRPLVLPEDWQFSHHCNTRGLKVFCTRKVRVIHHGEGQYPNDLQEDGWEYDLGDDPGKYEEVRAARAREARGVTA